MRYRPRQLLIFDIYENCAYELEMELRNKYGADINVVTLIGSIRDIKRLDEVFETYHPSVVFHAAAHKHVPLMEVSPAEAVDVYKRQPQSPLPALRLPTGAGRRWR